MDSQSNSPPRKKPHLESPSVCDTLDSEDPEAPSFCFDLCFLMDCTSSMSSSIDKVAPQLGDLVKALQSELTFQRRECILRTAFAVYRDHDAELRLEGLDFSEDHRPLRMKLMNIRTVGGSDTPEDVVGGLNLALNFKWKGHQRLLIMLGDAPCHGNRYHVGIDDNYPDGDPNGLTPEDILAKMKEKRISFIFIKLSSDTNKMLEIFRSVYASSSVPTSPGVSFECIDSRKELRMDVKNNLLNSIVPNIRYPKSLLFQCARFIKITTKAKHRQTLEGLLPEEMLELMDNIFVPLNSAPEDPALYPVPLPSSSARVSLPISGAVPTTQEADSTVTV